MAKRGGRLCAGCAPRACGPRSPALPPPPLLLLLLLAGLALRGEARTPGGDGFSLHPPYFNLAEGARITAGSWLYLCTGPSQRAPGLGGGDYLRIVGQYCDICTAANSNKAHPVSNAIDGTERWWQSPPLSRGLEYNEVNVTLDLGQVFHVAYVLIKFANSPRPDLWVLERSTDFGHTYQPWQFFASSKRDCLERFGPRTLERITRDDDVICTTEYSRIVPLENGEIVVSLVNGRPGAMNFSYSPLLRDFTKATNIRLRFLRTNTLLGHLMGKALRDPTVTRRQWKQELSQDNATLKATLQAASLILGRVSELLQGMDQAKVDLEHLAASLDGAWTPLLKKMQAFSPASSKVDLVEAAEAHAQKLNQLAINLSGIIQGINQDRFIQRAVEASNAYSSILQAVEAAEGAAGQALQQASRTWETVVQRGLAARARQLLANSSLLEETILGHRERLGVAQGRLQAAGIQLHDVRARKDQLAAQIRDAQAMLAMDTGETSQKIAHAKAVATEALDIATHVQSQLQNMQKNVERWQSQLGGLRGQDLGQVERDASSSVSTLEKTLPQLLAKLSRLENRGVHNASLALSANIGRVRKLIAQARGAANKVKVSMKFNGRSGVQLRAPRDLADLAAYTALKFYLQSPVPAPAPGENTGDRFVLYMGSRQATGDYMGVSLRNQKVHWVYRLGKAGPTTLSIDENIGEQFAAISIDRTLQFGHMSVTVESHMVQEIKGDTVAPGLEGLLSLRPDDFVFYVGGYPSNFTPPEPLRLPGYLGCIEMDTLNEEVVSLYNFEQTFKLDTAVDKPCARSKATGDPWLTDGSYLDGSGFARISFEKQSSHTKRFDQEMRLVSYNGIIFFLKQEARLTLQFLCLAVQDGTLVLLYDFGSGLESATPLQPPQPLTAASKAIQVFLLAGSRKRVLVRVERATVFSVEQDNTLEMADAYYLGGVPPEQLPPSLRKLFPSGGSVRGCIKGIKALGKYVDLKRLNTTGISFGCTADLLVGRAMTFHGHGYLALALPDVVPITGNIYSGFGFRGTQENSLLYHRVSPDGSYQVSLDEGHLTLQFMETAVKTQGVFADGAPHYVAFYTNSTQVNLFVDDQLQTIEPYKGTPATLQPQPEEPRLLLGGLPKSGTSHNFSGCISNVFVQRLRGPQRVFDLQQNMGSVNVSIGCTPAQLVRTSRTTAQKVSRRSRQPSQDLACTPPWLPGTIQDSYQFGGPLPSYLQFVGVSPSRRNRLHLSMLVRPHATSQGLLLSAIPQSSHGPSLVLFLSHGHFVAQTEGPGPRLQVQSHKHSQAGQWHRVSVRWGTQQIQLVVDGSQTRSQKAPRHRVHRAEGPQPHTLFVGGLPASSYSSRLPVSIGFSGCVKNLQLDKRPLRAPTQMVGVVPCVSGPLQDGLFFPGSEGIVILELSKAKLSSVSLELEIRPLAAAGLIFHLGQAQATPYVQLQVLTEQVLLRASDGAGEFSTWVSYPKLCDGQWHRVAVIQSRNALHLEVDTHSNHTTGPLPATLANTPGLLHLGGLPKAAAAQPEPPAYRGCMRNLVVNGDPVTLATAQIQGAVGANGCPSGTPAPDPAHSAILAKPTGLGKALTQRQVGSSGLRQASLSTLPLLQR
ncbi:Laminin subunit alpha-5 [Microtus ochrogaster]|uniref:Laminin subunit alpha-5 n=1 Tax=Microtus ochrogaster TaxID=79684 RepID=A0A8J6KVU4_MICOH|nr:Laminin subunit alpha-5 [Microtus ochrogaster]